MHPCHRSPGSGRLPKADVSVKSTKAIVKELPVFSLGCTYQVFAPSFQKTCFYKALLPLPVFPQANYKKENISFPKMKEELDVVFNTYLFTLGKQETHDHCKVGVARQSKINLNQQSISVIDSGMLHCHVKSDSSKSSSSF